MHVGTILNRVSCWHLERFAPLLLRLITGYGFMEHGWAKLARGPDSFVHILQALGVPMPELAA